MEERDAKRAHLAASDAAAEARNVLRTLADVLEAMQAANGLIPEPETYGGLSQLAMMGWESASRACREIERLRGSWAA